MGKITKNNLIKNSNYEPNEVLQYYLKNQEGIIFESSVSARSWLKHSEGQLSLLGGSRSAEDFWHKIYANIANFFLDATEEVIGQSLFIKRDQAQQSINDFNVEVGLKTLAQSLLDDGIIKNLNYTASFNDEPKIFCFGAQYGDLVNKISDSGGPPSGGGSGGSSLTSMDEALTKCLCEATERACGSFYRKEDLIFSSYKELKNQGFEAVDPKEFSGFSEQQLKEEPHLKMAYKYDDSVLGWVRGKSLITGKKKLVPAQLVYVPYRYNPNEPMIRLPITTGAAIHTEENEAMYRGICEAVERDSFMIFYLNRLSPPIIDLENSFGGEFKKIVKMVKKYQLEVYVLDITTDIPIPTFLTVVIDRTGIGPAVSVGNKSDFDSKRAIRGSIEEALKTRPWTRRQFLQEPGSIKTIRKNSKTIRTLQERCLFWSPLKMIKEIEFFLQGSTKILNSETAAMTSKEKLNKALQYFKDRSSEAIAVETTIPQVKKYGFRAFMILIPELQPLYLWEEYKCLGGRRLYEVPVKLGYLKKPKKEEELNKIPHPFP